MRASAGVRTLLRQALGFVVAGGINTVVSYACYLALLRVLGHQPAYAVAYVLGIGVSYVLNARFVFRSKPRLGRALAFPLVYLAQWVIGAALLEILVRAGIDKRLAPLVVIAVTLPLSFVFVRRILADRQRAAEVLPGRNP